VRRKPIKPNRINQTHAMDFLNYSYLQSGQLAKARAVIMDEHHVVGATDKSMKTHMDELNDRLLVELHNWKDAANLPDEFLFTKTIAADSIERSFRRAGPLGTTASRGKKALQERKKGNYTGAPDNDVQLREVEAVGCSGLLPTAAPAYLDKTNANPPSMPALSPRRVGHGLDMLGSIRSAAGALPRRDGRGRPTLAVRRYPTGLPGGAG